MDSKICFEMISFVVEAIRERCASFRSLTATVSEIFGGQTNLSILVVCVYHLFVRYNVGTIEYRSINKNKHKLSD